MIVSSIHNSKIVTKYIDSIILNKVVRQKIKTIITFTTQSTQSNYLFLREDSFYILREDGTKIMREDG